MSGYSMIKAEFLTPYVAKRERTEIGKQQNILTLLVIPSENRTGSFIAGWTGVVPARSHKPNDAGSTPAPATLKTTNAFMVYIGGENNGVKSFSVYLDRNLKTKIK